MEHMKILGIKFAVIFVIVLSMFGIFDHMPIVNLFWISLLTTAVSYVIGDLFLFKWFGNVVALVLDFGLAFVMFWFLGNFFIGTGYPVIPMAFFAAFFFFCSELFVHGYMLHLFSETDKPVETRDFRTLKELQVEFADEADIEKSQSEENK